MNARHLADILHRHAASIGSRPAIRYKRDGKYQDLSWKDYHERAQACAAALVDAGMKLGDRVGLLGENSLEWLLADMGILTAGTVTVSPHSSLSARQVQYQMVDAGARWIFVSTAEQLEKIRHLRREMPLLEGVVIFDPAAAGPDAISWQDFLERGRQALAKLEPELIRRRAELKPDDLATIMYTSGTTGEPKGVMLTHHNILSNVVACLESEPVVEDDINLCWLPLSHIYARTIDHYERLHAGIILALAENALTVVANLAEIQPSHLSCVPRFYEKVLALVTSPDPAVTAAKLRHIFGPRIRALGAGGAPLPLPIEQTLKAAGLPILPGYGLTESSPVISFNLTKRNKLGTVGPALPGVEVKISPEGEILARGPNIMKGYWNKPRETAETIKDGWLHTGDLGTLDADGFLTITGRMKEIMVLSNGKKVAPNQVEGMLIADDCIDQAIVYGEGRNFLTALIVPLWERTKPTLAAVGVQVPAEASPAELAKHPAVNEFFRRKIEKALVDLAGYEQVKKFIILPAPFSVAADELTVSLKMRRNVIFQRYQAELDALYWE